ncbi:MAG: C39 family peptidase [Candidatus Saccharibacteria bacterium]|nr:C39 family peptidase [Candidatus Saccharibacteria bacterium]
MKRRKIAIIFSIIFCCSIISSYTVYAFEFSELFGIRNDIRFYNPNGECNNTNGGLGALTSFDDIVPNEEGKNWLEKNGESVINNKVNKEIVYDNKTRKQLYIEAAKEIGFVEETWIFLAMVDFRERGFGTDKTILNGGNSFGTSAEASLDKNAPGKNYFDDLKVGLEHLQGWAERSGFSLKSTTNWTIDNIGNMFLGWGRGFLYERANLTWRDFGYLLNYSTNYSNNGYLDHQGYCEQAKKHGFECGHKDSRPGAFLIYNYLMKQGGGSNSNSSTASSGSNSNQSIGQRDNNQKPFKLMKINDVNRLAEAIDKWTEQSHPDSPFRGLGKDIVAGGMAEGINPVIVYTLARQESSLGTANTAKVKDGKNSFGRRATKSQPHIITAKSGYWYKWNSFRDSIFGKDADNMFIYVNRIYGSDLTLPEFIHKYAPSSDGNNEKLYVDHVTQWTNEIYALAGDAIDAEQLGSSVEFNSNNNCVSSTINTGTCGNWKTNGEPGTQVVDGLLAYYQYQEPWKNKTIKQVGQKIVDFGCGPTTLAIIIANLTCNQSVTPETIAELSSFANVGISWGSFTSVPAKFNLKVTKLENDSSKAVEALKRGSWVINSQGPGDFTTSGHIMALRGLDNDGKIKIIDPASEQKTKSSFTQAQIQAASKNYWEVSR